MLLGEVNASKHCCNNLLGLGAGLGVVLEKFEAIVPLFCTILGLLAFDPMAFGLMAFGLLGCTQIHLGLNKIYYCMRSCAVLIFSHKILSDWITIFCLVLNFRINHSFFALLWHHTYKTITIFYHLHSQTFHILTLYSV